MEKKIEYKQTIKPDKSASDYLRELYPEDGRVENFSREVTFQLGEACFSDGVKIAQPNGREINIEDIKVGDVILGFDINENRYIETTVTYTYSQEVKSILRVETNDSVFYVTPEHPFYDANRHIVRAINLGKGTMLLSRDGHFKTVRSAKMVDRDCKIYNFETDCHTYIANDLISHNCNLACTYCYQKDKTAARVMTLETGKKIVDLLYRMWDEDKPNAFINKKTKMVILDFIGGEPMLYTNVMDGIISYFWQTAILRRHIWAETFMISIATNGTLHFKPEVQAFINKYKGHLSYGVSIDGPKEMHDACRVYYDGRGSFDDAYAAQEDYNKKFTAPSGTKATIARANLPYLSTLIKYYVNQGYQQIHANYVYEEEWNNEDAKLLYDQMEEISDYILGLPFPVELSLFDDRYFTPMDEDDNRNWCWGKGTPVLTTTGYKPIEDIKIGDLVYTEDGTIHPVINTMSHFADNVVEIKASGMFPLVCTDNHKLFVRKFDYRGNKGKLHFKELDGCEVKDIGSNDLIEIATLPERTKSIDKSVAKLVGRFIGDGYYSQANGYGICCGLDEYDELKELWDNAGIPFRANEHKETWQLNPLLSKCYGNENFELYQRLCSECGHLAAGKRVPSEALTWDNETLSSLLDGYLSADGHFKKSKGIMSCNTVSYELANDIVLITQTLGYKPVCHIEKRNGKMNILGRECDVHDRYEIYWQTDPNKSKYLRVLDGKRYTYRFSMTPVEPQEVYNITVDENHSYVASGIDSLNCGGTGAMVAFDPVGKAYPCIRYMDSSLAGDMPGLVIGDTDGIWDERYKDVTDAMNAVTRRSQSTDECFYCPIASGCSWCVRAGTKILTKSGEKNIETLNVGDKIISAENIERVVTRVYKRMADDTRLLRFSNGVELYTTDNHPIMCLKGGFVAAADLKLGTVVRTTYGTTVLTASIPQEPYEVYNLTIERDNSYIANGIKVHNCSGWNYQSEGSFNKRSTRICPMHKARSLACVKHFNKLYLKNGDKKTFHRFLPDEEALKIISQEELDILNDLEEQTKKLAPEGYDQRDYRFCSSC